MDKDNDASNTDFSFTDIDLDPITCDTNPAHFDGFLYEIADYCKRTGKFLPLLQQGVTIRGHKTIVDSPAAVPFIQGGVTRAKDYDAFDPCPPTSQRLSGHNSRMAQTDNAQILGLTKIDPSNSDFILTNFWLTPRTSPSATPSPSAALASLTSSTGFVASTAWAVGP